MVLAHLEGRRNHVLKPCRAKSASQALSAGLPPKEMQSAARARRLWAVPVRRRLIPVSAVCRVQKYPVCATHSGQVREGPPRVCLLHVAVPEAGTLTDGEGPLRLRLPRAPAPARG